jgi:hypothetical protein
VISLGWEQVKDLGRGLLALATLLVTGATGYWLKQRQGPTASTSIAPPPLPPADVLAQQSAETLRLVQGLHQAMFIEERDGTRRLAARESTNAILAGMAETAGAIKNFSQVLSEDSLRRTSMVEELGHLFRQVDERMRLVENSNQEILRRFAAGAERKTE